MVATASVLGVTIGAAVARLSERFPNRIELLETVAGFLLLGSFAAIGCMLPAML
jgi:hypothetical protein